MPGVESYTQEDKDFDGEQNAEDDESGQRDVWLLRGAAVARVDDSRRKDPRTPRSLGEQGVDCGEHGHVEDFRRGVGVIERREPLQRVPRDDPVGGIVGVESALAQTVADEVADVAL